MKKMFEQESFLQEIYKVLSIHQVLLLVQSEEIFETDV